MKPSLPAYSGVGTHPDKRLPHIQAGSFKKLHIYGFKTSHLHLLLSEVSRSAGKKGTPECGNAIPVFTSVNGSSLRAGFLSHVNDQTPDADIRGLVVYSVPPCCPRPAYARATGEKRYRLLYKMLLLISAGLPQPVSTMPWISSPLILAQ